MRKNLPRILFLIMLLLITCIFSACTPADTKADTDVILQSDTHNLQKTTSNNVLRVHFLDVGQGLSILVQSGEHTLIYDGGDRTASSFVVSYIKSLNITKLDYLISSHYDEDHLAGLVGCLNAFNVDNVISSDYIHDTKLYDSFTTAVAEKGLSMQHPAVGTEFSLGDATFTILAPTAISNESNANSVVIKLVYGQSSFLFTGDANVNSETVMCNTGINLDCDVLSISHHGSATATSYDFLAATLPESAVISAGTGNQYGHPNRDVTERLELMEIDLFRTDLQGTLIATSDGNSVSWNVAPCNDYAPGDITDLGTTAITEVTAEPADTIANMVWKSRTGTKYHSINDCGKMNPDAATTITLAEAEALGLEQCKVCW